MAYKDCIVKQDITMMPGKSSIGSEQQVLKGQVSVRAIIGWVQ